MDHDVIFEVQIFRMSLLIGSVSRVVQKSVLTKKTGFKWYDSVSASAEMPADSQTAGFTFLYSNK